MGEAAALLAILSVGTHTRAAAKGGTDTVVDQSAAAGGAVSVAGALAGDELAAGTVADVASTGRVGDEGAGHDGATNCTGITTALVVVVVVVATIVTTTITAAVVTTAVTAGIATLETAALLAGLSLSTYTGAHTNGLTSPREGSTAARGTVGGAVTLASNELATSSVADVLLTGGIGEGLALREVRSSVDGSNGHCLSC